MRRLVEKISNEKYAVMQWHKYCGDITSSLKVRVDFTLPALSVENVMTWKFHADESAKGRHDMFLGQDLLT